LLRRLARTWILVATVVFLALGLRDGAPTNPDLGSWQQPVQFGLLVLTALGGLIALRWEALGATLISFGAIFLGVFAAVDNPPWLAFCAAAVFLVPGVLIWIVWQRRQSRVVVAGLAIAMAMLLASGAIAAAYVHSYLFGPTHPQSTLAAPPIEQVEWIWSGAATTNSITVKARLARDSANVRLIVSEAPDMTDQAAAVPAAHDPGDRRLVTFTVGELAPDTRYFYAVEADGRLELARRGQFTTFPAGPASFSFAFSACARTGSNGVVFDAIRATDPLFYLVTGDLYYTHMDQDDPAAFRAEYETVLAQPAQAALYRSAPLVYVWDDHDYGPNDGDRTSPTRDAARTAYREYLPHYPLAAPDAAIYQAFTVGRVRFIVTDIRSERDPNAEPDTAAKSMLGEAQKAWFKAQLLAANGRFPIIIWVNSGPWIDPAGAGKDSWGGFATERRELADFMVEHHIQGLVMLSGDAHAVAIDAGSNSDFSSAGGGGFPVMHAAPLDNRPGIKGGPYSEGVSLESGQFGLVTITDEGGDTVTVTLSGRNYSGQETLQYSLTVAVSAASR
jgi:phosphodiesterase/alkaline phosphatase D-like protein